MCSTCSHKGTPIKRSPAPCISSKRPSKTMCVIFWLSSASRAELRPYSLRSGWGWFPLHRQRRRKDQTMRKPIWDGYMNAAIGRTLKQDKYVLSRQARPEWRRFANDSLLALVGVALATAAIAFTHLYPRIPSVVLAYLLVI